jgi:hypothetical protein
VHSADNKTNFDARIIKVNRTLINTVQPGKSGEKQRNKQMKKNEKKKKRAKK